ncbi:NAD(P)/FAD-dependent oxidoreductase [Gayadomonas joobiniege]|uniref:NAD(P)/FAD-dependent oxidoreductase n=1 Tax=Gayadomonas joobiniege TaxID=1234606 RepID=UPI00037A1605|nr:NAD(P)/FAD-dependent oxidoreductase [Gayadomonas joobiniege]
MAKQIVIVGGGAGGLELATKLGNKFKNTASVDVLLLDKYPYHIWKPLFHEVAAGSLDVDMDGVDFRAHATNNHFEFQKGEVYQLDRENQEILIKAICDEHGEQLVPPRRVRYDTLVFAIGSITNDFNTAGVKTHCLTLDTTKQAEQFHSKILNEFLKLKANDSQTSLKINIIGAGATGVELAAELYKLTDLVSVYGFDKITRNSVEITLIEAAPRILSALPERISDSALKVLKELGVIVRTGTMVKEAHEKGVETTTGELINSNINVWCAGVKVPEFMNNIGGLATNKINQLVITETLQSESDENIFAIGDCASLQQKDGSYVPPRAQSAHQMADQCYKNICAQLDGHALSAFEYKDKGSLISFAEYTSVGFLSSVTNKKVFIEGSIARKLYVSLYRLHQAALHGYGKMLLLMLVGRINRRLRPKLKLH